MKIMKYILTALLIFGTMPLTHDSVSAESLLTTDGLRVKKLSRSISSVLPAQNIEVELIRMVDPFGNEVKYSLSEKVMGRALSADDYSIPGVNQPQHSVLCQKTLSSSRELKKVELKLELEMLVEKLALQEKPRVLTELQIETIGKVPTCESFQLPLTAINKLLGGYDFESLAMVSEK